MIKIAIAVNGGHVARAIDFYKSPNKYFIIGGTTPWEDDANPRDPLISDYKLNDVIGLVRIKEENIHLVVPDTEGAITYRAQNWRIVDAEIETSVSALVPSGSKEITVNSLEGLAPGVKVRVNNLYEGIIEDYGLVANTIKLDKAAPENIPVGSTVVSGALVEGAKYVYMECTLNYNYNFPTVDNAGNKVAYRQVGICSGVVGVSGPNEDGSLYSIGYKGRTDKNDYTSLGTLEILDNRPASTRDENKMETLSLIIEF